MRLPQQVIRLVLPHCNAWNVMKMKWKEETKTMITTFVCHWEPWKRHLHTRVFGGANVPFVAVCSRLCTWEYQFDTRWNKHESSYLHVVVMEQFLCEYVMNICEWKKNNMYKRKPFVAHIMYKETTMHSISRNLFLSSNSKAWQIDGL